MSSGLTDCPVGKVICCQFLVPTWWERTDSYRRLLTSIYVLWHVCAHIHTLVCTHKTVRKRKVNEWDTQTQRETDRQTYRNIKKLCVRESCCILVFYFLGHLSGWVLYWLRVMECGGIPLLRQNPLGVCPSVGSQPFSRKPHCQASSGNF